MFVEYEVLNKNTEKNASELFSEVMKKLYKGEEMTGPCWRKIDVMSYNIDNNKVYVSKEPFYRESTSSVSIIGRNHKEISETKSKLEKETEFKLKLIKKGKG